MEGGMRMPPNPTDVGGQFSFNLVLQWRAACACRRMRLSGREHNPGPPLQWRAACACRRIAQPQASRV